MFIKIMLKTHFMGRQQGSHRRFNINLKFMSAVRLPLKYEECADGTINTKKTVFLPDNYSLTQ